MRRYVPRALLTVAVAVSAAACTVGPTGGVAGATASGGGSEGGRYRVLVPALSGSSQGDRVSDRLRDLIAGMATHTSIGKRDMNRAMGQFGISDLDEATARQLAQQMNAELVMWGTVQEGGSGLQADVQFVDTRSGDQIDVEASGADANALAQAIFTDFEQSVEGIRQAAFCNDYLASQQYERAVETCNQALAIVPRSTTALYAKATAQLNLEQDAEALATYEQLLEVDPVHEDALLGAGLAASRLQNPNAMSYYNRYLEVNPGNVQVRMTVANDIAKTGDYVSAFRVLEGAAADNADNADFQKYLFSIATAAGQRVQEQQDQAAARPFFQAALTAYQAAYSSPDAQLDASALRQAIAVNNALGDTQAALEIARRATAQFDTVASIWSQYATVLNEAGQHAEAVNALTRVAELDPSYPDVFIRRAMANMEAGQRQAAVADLERAAQSGNRENVARVLYSMASAPLQAENWSEAASFLSMAHGYAEGSTKSDIAFFWGYSLYKQGEAIARANTQGAVEPARQALDFFERALPLVQSSSHSSAGQVVSAAQQYIENQRAIIDAARG